MPGFQECEEGLQFVLRCFLEYIYCIYIYYFLLLLVCLTILLQMGRASYQWFTITILKTITSLATVRNVFKELEIDWMQTFKTNGWQDNHEKISHVSYVCGDEIACASVSTLHMCLVLRTGLSCVQQLDCSQGIRATGSTPGAEAGGRETAGLSRGHQRGHQRVTPEVNWQLNGTTKMPAAPSFPIVSHFSSVSLSFSLSLPLSLYLLDKKSGLAEGSK